MLIFILCYGSFTIFWSVVIMSFENLYASAEKPFNYLLDVYILMSVIWF